MLLIKYLKRNEFHNMIHIPNEPLSHALLCLSGFRDCRWDEILNYKLYFPIWLFASLIKVALTFEL